MNRERVIKVVEEELTRLGIDNVEPENAYSKGYKVSHILADRIIAEEADDDALGIAYKKGFEDGKARAEEGKVIDEILKQAPLEVENNDEGSEIPQQPKLPEKLDTVIITLKQGVGKRLDISHENRLAINQIIDYLKAREEK